MNSRELALNPQHYEVFLETCKKGIRRIAQHSRGESQVGDVNGELWLTADELSKKRHYPIDFCDPEDQNLLIAYTYQKLVRYCETNVRYATRIDDFDAEGDQPNYANILTQGEIEDPLNQLIRQASTPTETFNYYSLGGAWIAVLDRCNNKMTSVAYFLKISLSHSYRCFNKALHVAKRQHHLPLNLPNNVALNPQPWRRYRLYRSPEQLAFTFDEELLC